MILTFWNHVVEPAAAHSFPSHTAGVVDPWVHLNPGPDPLTVGYYDFDRAPDMMPILACVHYGWVGAEAKVPRQFSPPGCCWCFCSWALRVPVLGSEIADAMLRKGVGKPQMSCRGSFTGSQHVQLSHSADPQAASHHRKPKAFRLKNLDHQGLSVSSRKARSEIEAQSLRLSIRFIRCWKMPGGRRGRAGLAGYRARSVLAEQTLKPSRPLPTARQSRCVAVPWKTTTQPHNHTTTQPHNHAQRYVYTDMHIYIYMYTYIYRCLYGMAWHVMVWFVMVWYGTVRYGTVRYGTVRYGTVRYGTVRYGTVRNVRVCNVM